MIVGDKGRNRIGTTTLPFQKAIERSRSLETEFVEEKEDGTGHVAGGSFLLEYTYRIGGL